MTDVNLDSIFSSLSASASQLNETSERCNRTLRDAQARLVTMNIGLEHWHGRPIARTDKTGDIGPGDLETEFVTLLGFTKVLGKWCLAVKEMRLVSGFYEQDMDSPFQNSYVSREPSPLLDSPREIRLSALKVLPEFLSDLVQVVQEANAELSRSCELLN
jgi:hypothetical protein